MLSKGHNIAMLIITFIGLSFALASVSSLDVLSGPHHKMEAVSVALISGG